jgi:glycosyltransferase involved in cell wall biosynthesis
VKARFGPVYLQNAWECVKDNRHSANRICIVPDVSGVGGMVSFRSKLVEGLKRRGLETCNELRDFPYRSVLLIGGTRDLVGIWGARRRGIPVVQRLDGMNWLHRLNGIQKAGWRHYLRAENGNLLLAFIRARLASWIVYQSEFSQCWWEKKRGLTRVKHSIINNGVDLEVFRPQGEGEPPEDRWRILMVEGSLMGGYEQGLQTAVGFVERLANLVLQSGESLFPGILELMVVGKVSEILKNRWGTQVTASQYSPHIRLNWAGLMPNQQIPVIDRSAHLLYSSDINPACPNSVIEALACGLPVVAFDTGALVELVTSEAGRVVSYGGDPWKLDPPDLDALARAAYEVLKDLASYRRAARQLAELRFGLDRMLDGYLDVLLEG